MSDTAWVQGYLGERLPGPMGVYVDLWIADLETRSRAEWTCYQYKREMQRLIESFPEKEAGEITKLDIDVWKMERGRGQAASSLRRALIAVRSFFTYCEDSEIIHRSPCRRIGLPPIPEPDPSFWTPDEVRQLLACPGLVPRDALFLNTLARCGQRVSPTRTLTWKGVHLDGKNPYIAFPKAKGGKFHKMPMDRTLYQLYKAYSQLVTTEGYVFVSRQRRRRDVAGTAPVAISNAQAWRIITNACRKSGVRVASAHEFRRSLATRLLADPTIPFAVVSKGVLNHSNPQTTLRHYAGQDFDQVAAALKETF